MQATSFLWFKAQVPTLDGLSNHSTDQELSIWLWRDHNPQMESSVLAKEKRKGECRAIFPSLKISPILATDSAAGFELRSPKTSDSQTWLNINNTENLIFFFKYWVPQP